MKPSLLILSTEAVAQMLHDHYMQEMKPHHNRCKKPEGHTVNLLWRDKVNDSHFIEQLESWRIIAERCIEELTPCIHIPPAPLSSASADADARDHHLTTGTASLAPEQKEFDATRSDAAKAVSSMAAHVSSLNDELYALTHERNELRSQRDALESKTQRLENELAQVRKHETQLIQERDRLLVLIDSNETTMKQAAQSVLSLTTERDEARAYSQSFSDRLKQADVETANVQAELQTTKEALSSTRHDKQELINRIREIATYAKATAGF